MKKTILILAAAASLGYFSSCKNGEETNTVTEPTFTQAQLDSIQKAKEDSINAANALTNDSLLNKMAQDSIAAAEAAKATATAGAAAGAAKAVTSNKKKPTTTKPNNNKPAEQAKQEVRTQEQVTADKKASRFGDKDAKDRLKQDEADKKAARLGDKNAQQKAQQTTEDKKASRFNK
ncbi:MAG TPA: hypothetical protein PKX92_00390 [Edaphocola sp.]|nr:hypothetical protein [Edaphocola sp.]